jgi:hypothetical protein
MTETHLTFGFIKLLRSAHPYGRIAQLTKVLATNHSGDVGAFYLFVHYSTALSVTQCQTQM